MDFVPIEQLAKDSGFSRRTIDRKIKALEKNDPEKFSTLAQRPGGGSNRIFYSPAILEHIGLTKEAVNQILNEVNEPDAKTVRAEIKKEQKEPRKKKADKERPAKPHIISLDPIPDDEQAIFDRIMVDYRTGQYSLPECIQRQGIDYATFWFWLGTRPDFHSTYDEVYKHHKKAYAVYLREIAKDSLKKMVVGYEKTMESVTFAQKVGPNGEVIQIPQERKVHQRYVMPNANMIMFALTNKDPDEWKRVFGNQLPQREPEQDPIEKMTTADLMAFLDQAKQNGLLNAEQ